MIAQHSARCFGFTTTHLHHRRAVPSAEGAPGARRYRVAKHMGVAVAVSFLVACTASDNNGAAVTVSGVSTASTVPASSIVATTAATTTTTTVAPTSTTTLPISESFDPAEEAAAQQRYVDAAAAHQACLTFDCVLAQALYDRTMALRDLTYYIKDPVYAEMTAGVQTAWAAWNTCLATATSRAGCSIQEGELEAAVDLLYDALR